MHRPSGRTVHNKKGYTARMMKNGRTVIFLLPLLLWCLVPLYPQPAPSSAKAPYRIPHSIRSIAELSTQRSLMTPAAVIRIVDGDTIVVSLGPVAGIGSTEKVRLIGVDTPEVVDPRRPVERFGAEASHYAREQLLGRPVWLAFEPRLRDVYGRLLAYVFLADGSCFNLQIVANGFGFAYTTYPFMFMADFREAERSARTRGRGLWGPD